MNKVKFADGIEVVKTSRNVLTVYFSGVKSGWEKRMLFRADMHHDSVGCDRSLEKEHLLQAKDYNGLVLNFGDRFDAMQGKYDPRRMPSDLRPEYLVDNYLDEIVMDAARFDAPFAKYELLEVPGNHEKDILKNNGVDLTSNFVHRMNTDNAATMFTGCYGGYVKFMFDSGKSISKTLKYFHGASLAMSKALVNKQAAVYPDADIIVNGHAHDSWYVPVARERLTQRGEVVKDIQHQFRTSSYKNDYGDGGDGWWVERGGSPMPLGAVWVRFFFKNGRIETEIIQDVR